MAYSNIMHCILAMIYDIIVCARSGLCNLGHAAQALLQNPSCEALGSAIEAAIQALPSQLV